MAGGQTCIRCGSPLADNAGDWQCKRCLLEIGLENSNANTTPPSEGSTNALRGAGAFGDYELLEIIAEGGMGVVYKARQISLSRLVALKLMRVPPGSSREFTRRFRTEAEAAAALEHPNIVPLYEVGDCDGRPYLSMRLIAGHTLAHALAAGEFEFATRSSATIRTVQLWIAQLMESIAGAIDYAHKHGVLHRDLKPSNILLDSEGQPHVADFGLAKLLGHDSQLTKSCEVVGTPSYMAPEQADGKTRQVTPKADVFSLGAILYELLSGVRPFARATVAETLRAVIEENPKHPRLINPHADGDLCTIALKCLHKAPSDRYQSAQALADDLRRWMRHEPILARPPSVFLRTRRWAQRKPAQAAILATLAVFACAFLSVLVGLAVQASETRTEREGLELHAQSLWDSSKAFIQIGSEVRRRCYPSTRQQHAVSSGPAQVHFIVGVYAHENPIETLHQFVELIDYLEGSLSYATDKKVSIALRIYRSNLDARNALIGGEIHFLRMGAGPYVEAKEVKPDIEVLARQLPLEFTAVLFVRSNTGITNVAQIKGWRMAFGHPDSTISGSHGVAFLGANEIRMSDFAATNYFNNHEQVLIAVADGKYDVGFAKKGAFKKFNAERGETLRAVASFPCTSMPWVANSQVPAVWRKSFQNVLLNLSRSNVLSRLPDACTGFTNAIDSDYDEVRRQKEYADDFKKK